MVEARPKSILIVAGEASGDLHGAALIQEILGRDSSIHIWGIGGHAMKTAGVELVAHSSDLAVTGLLEVFFKLRKILSLFSLLLKRGVLEKPSLAILIDYPDFNLRLAQKLRRKGVPVLYYISPQVWAWRKRRVHFIRKWVTKMLVVFPFEVSFYRGYGVEVDFVGHPLLDHAHPTLEKDEAQSYFELDPQKKTMGLLPGSRKNEVHYLLGPMIEAALKIHKENPQTQFLLPIAPTLSLDEIHQFLKGVPFPIRCVQEKFYDVLSVCDVVVCCSGTATLETALFGKPMVILYKFNWMSHFLGRLLIRKIQFFGMPNIILGKKVVPELLQSQVTGENIAKEVLAFLRSPELLQKTSAELLQVREKLGTQGATQRAADHVFELLNKGDIFNPLKTIAQGERAWFRVSGERARALSANASQGHLIACLKGIKNISLLYVLHKIFSPLLWIVSLIYRVGIECRKFLYRIGVFKSGSVPAKVISIGNIAIGGTGKTPLTMHVAQELTNQGKKVAILSRGYKRKSKAKWECVSDGSGPMLSHRDVGDEPWLMASKLPHIPIYVGGNRYRLAQEVMRQRPIDIFLLDDGFQHWKLKRNADVVTIDVTRFQKNKALLPLGFFREPLSGLKRAQCFVLVRTDHLNSFEKEEILEALYRVHPPALVVEANYQPRCLQHIVSKQNYSLHELSGKKIFAFAGIGNPSSFKRVLKDLNADLVMFKSYLDHWQYSARDVRQILQCFHTVKTELCITTEKDGVRLSDSHLLKTFGDIPLYALSVDLKITNGEVPFRRFLQTI
ncbi:MAG: lipid-A-disaccharide synthase [Deltaproteobacteria bacterium]|nr:lipid-A-disaccharide synthase [Deltaproteobacteria bacterium]